MIRAALAILATIAAAAAWAQEQPSNSFDGEQNGSWDGFTLTPELDLEAGGDDGLLTLPPVEEEVLQDEIALGQGAMLRGLDRVSGAVTDFELGTGQAARFERLTVELGECRYPKDDPASDAFGYLVIRYDGSDAPTFKGWMVASSPALNAMDHPRYDVWLLRCKTS